MVPVLSIQMSDNQELETLLKVLRKVPSSFFAATGPSVRRRSGAQMNFKRQRDYVCTAQEGEHDSTATLP